MRLRAHLRNGHADSSRWLASQLFAASGGAGICALLFGTLGSMSRQTTLGASIGAIVGAFLGCGLLNGLFGSFVVWVVGSCMLGALLGPAIDADPVSSALVGAGFGVYFAITKWRGLLMLIGGILGLNIGATLGISSPSGMLGLSVGALFGFVVGYAISPLKYDASQLGSHDAPNKQRDESER